MSTPINNKNRNNNNQLIELKKKIIELEKRLTQSEEKNELLERRITLVESENSIIKKVNNELVKEIDRVDQYSRRSNVIMKNVFLKENETQEQLEQKVKTLITRELDVPEAVEEIDKLHRVGKVKTLENGKKQQNIIVRFKSHSARYKVYNARKKLNNIKISPNLTHRRGKLWYDASMHVKKFSSSIDFIFADLHGNLKMKTKEEIDGKNKFGFESLDDLEKVTERLGLVQDE